MAYNNNNNGNNKVFEPNYYAKTYFNNYEAELGLSITFGSGLIKIAIRNAPKESGSDRNDIISASLTGLKASLFVDALNHMEKDITDGIAEGRSYGTSSGMGDIVKAIAITVEDGKKKLVIAKVDTAGTVSEKTVYTFESNVNYYMTWNNFDKMKYGKEYDNELEYQMFKNTLIDFARNISGASAYGGLYLNRYEANREHTRINQIMDKLGINVAQSRNNSFQRSENSFFNGSNNTGNKNSEHVTYSDIESMLGGSEDDD